MKDEIRESLENILKGLLPIAAALQAVVVSVDQDKAICKVKLVRDELELEGVRLRAVADQSVLGLLPIPKINSKVIVGFINNSLAEAYVISFSELDKFQVITKDIQLNADEKILISADEIILNSGEFGGLIKIEELKTQVDKNSAILDIILEVMRAMPPILEPGNGAASSLQLALKTALTGREVADLTNIENDKIKHG